MSYPPNIPENTYWKHDIDGGVIKVLRLSPLNEEGYLVTEPYTECGLGFLNTKHIVRCYTQIAEEDVPLALLGDV